ncbi:hypothetical protein THRCLA_22334 [Thraustotheca clavata]|uniref:Uncharacterized protein n=1 Tax=Thraustotheca clavata TaxID=74557 RepID=A0A1V9Z5B0_9STRA|nr:hypothetical protein THRCLA_22334 [Thraustotheca clavata]
MRNEELLDDMTRYSLGNCVKEMLQIMMERIIIEQPNAPIDFLIQVVQNDPQIIALDIESRYHRMDLRSMGTKTRYLKLIFNDIVPKSSTDVTKAIFLEKLQQSSLLHEYFPRHRKDITSAFLQQQKQLPSRISFIDFSLVAKQVLSNPSVL